MKCKSCKHSVFDEKWGEYKCKKKQIRIYNAKKYENCEDYERKKKDA